MESWKLVASAVMLASAAGAASAQCSSDKACSPAADGVVVRAAHTTAADDIVDTAVKAGSFKTLAAALTAAGLVETLKGDGPFTVFAPTDEAFAKLPKGTLEKLLKPENKDELVAILTYHVVTGEVRSDKVVGLKSAGTVNGQRVDIAVKDGVVRLDNRAKVLKTDIACSNGVIHVIDEVILPVRKDVLGVAGEAGSFSTLAAAIEAAGLTAALQGQGPFTVFAPTDEAFAKLPAGTVETLLKPENKEKLARILKLHVVPGRFYADQIVEKGSIDATLAGPTLAFRVKGASVTVGAKGSTAAVAAADVEAANGVIHVIDTVLLPE